MLSRTPDSQAFHELSAFGSTLVFLGANPRHDIAVFRGQPGAYFELDPTIKSAGTRVELMSYPQAFDIDLKSHLPACSQGQVSAYSSDSMLGVADYQGGASLSQSVKRQPCVAHLSLIRNVLNGIHVLAGDNPCLATVQSLQHPCNITGMPNSSGGAVVISSRRLIGLHVGSCWHRDTCATNGTSEGGSCMSEGGSCTSTEPPDILEVDALSMWREPDDGQAEMLPDHVAAQESYANIPVSVAFKVRDGAGRGIGSTRRGRAQDWKYETGQGAGLL